MEASNGTKQPPEAEVTGTATAVLFGFPPSDVAVRIRPNPMSWRASGAAQRLGGALVAAPLLALVPPHAPWAIGALVAGGVLARRRWAETHTLRSVEGPCPKCGGLLSVRPTRLKRPHPLECEGCHHVSSLRVPAALTG